MKQFAINLLKRYRTSREWLALREQRKDTSYLRDTGWLESRFQDLPVDRQGYAVPWITYPSLAFLEPRINAEMSVFEYGSGNSTLWWSSRVRRVVSCEHHRGWYERMAPELPANVDYKHLELTGGYPEAIAQHANEFDVIVIDGRERVKCAYNSLGALKDSGVILWDNSEREKYRPAFDFLAANGFRKLDFWGIGPVESYGWCTSILYRSNNCFSI